MNARDFRLLSIRWLVPLPLWGSIVGPAVVAQSMAGQNHFVGSAQCAACHQDVASAQMSSEHARSLRKVTEIPGLAQALPLHFSDKDSRIQYRIESSNRPEVAFDLIAVKDQQAERL